MSIIHQALKKLEGVRDGRGGASLRADGVREGAVGGRPAGIQLAVLLAMLIAAVIMLADTAVRGLGPESGGAFNEARTDGARNAPALSAAALDRNSAGIGLYMAGRFSDAADEFRKALTLLPEGEPSAAVFFNNLGQAYSALGELSMAEDAFNHALALTPAYPEAANNYGTLLDRRGDRRGAALLFKKAIAMRPDYPDPYLNLAVNLERQGLYEQAISNYERFIELDGKRPPDERRVDAGEIAKKLKRLRSGALYPENGPGNGGNVIP